MYIKSRLILLLLIIFSGFNAMAIDIVSEVMLTNKNSQMIKQVSGLARLNQWVFVLGQDQNKLYYINDSVLTEAFAANKHQISLNEITLAGELPPASWEAISIGTIDNKHYVFLTHEHDFEGDHHQVYFAELTFTDRDVTLGILEKLGPALPSLTNEAVNKNVRYNYGYEAIAWHDKSKRLILIPELKSQPKLALTLQGELSHLPNASHDLRASDMTYTDNQCFLVTSNCYASSSFTDALCETGDLRPQLSIASFKVTNNDIQMADKLDVTGSLLAVGAIETAPENTATIFNMEGITRYKNGFLVVNDNIPRGYAKTVLRYIQLPQYRSDTCTLQP